MRLALISLASSLPTEYKFLIPSNYLKMGRKGQLYKKF